MSSCAGLVLGDVQLLGGDAAEQAKKMVWDEQAQAWGLGVITESDFADILDGLDKSLTRERTHGADRAASAI